MNKEITTNLEDKIIDAIARALILIAKNLVPNDNENEHSGDNNKG